MKKKNCLFKNEINLIFKREREREIYSVGGVPFSGTIAAIRTASRKSISKFNPNKIQFNKKINVTNNCLN